jgi:perosamine synthetase
VTLRSVAPAGAPITAADLVRWARSAFLSVDAPAALERAVCERFGVAHARAASTGRAGMTLLLKALRRLAPAHRDEVLIPSYTCYSVAASIVKAGLRPRLVDVSSRTLDYEPSQLEREDGSRVLALVATNLYGEPSDMKAWQAFARARQIFLVDDAAQSMGASVSGRWSGTCGDVGLFSFDKGKPVSAIDGGVIVTDSAEIDAALAAEMAALPRPDPAQSAKDVAKALAYFVFLRPWLYWIPDRLPQLELGKTVFTTEFPVEAPDAALSALARTTLPHLDDYVRARTATAVALRAGVATLRGVRLVASRPNVSPGHLRLPLVFDDADVRRHAHDHLRAAGFGASGSYPASLADVPRLQPLLAAPPRTADGGRYVAARILTLPTHPFVTSGDVIRMLSILEALVGRSTRTATPDCHPAPSVVCVE